MDLIEQTQCLIDKTFYIRLYVVLEVPIMIMFSATKNYIFFLAFLFILIWIAKSLAKTFGYPEVNNDRFSGLVSLIFYCCFRHDGEEIELYLM